MNKYLQIIRRRLFLIFRKKYILDSIKKRKGRCSNCSCCEVTLFGRKWNCKYFDKKNKLCKVYRTNKMPFICNVYPFDEKDKWNEFKNKCTFYWEENE